MFSILNTTYLIELLLSALAALIAIVVHEISHGFAAYMIGDKTAKRDGRLSLNPLRHIDWIGAICLIVFKFGWAKPVPVNPYMFKNRKWGIIFVSFAGPLSNFIMAFIGMFAMCLVQSNPYVFLFFWLFSSVNVGLGVFNLIPFPPLDGSKILAQFLPAKTRYHFLQLERYGPILLFVIIYVLNRTNLLSMLINWIYTGMLSLVFGVFGL